MITVKPFEGTWNSGFIVKGHAEHGQYGADIVCSAVSAIAQTIHMGIRRYSGTQYKIRDGYMEVQVYKQEDQCVEALIAAFVRGITDIAEQYPENVEIIEGDLK